MRHPDTPLSGRALYYAAMKIFSPYQPSLHEIAERDGTAPPDYSGAAKPIGRDDDPALETGDLFGGEE